MTSTPRSPQRTSDNERTSVNSHFGGQRSRGDQPATPQEREEASRSPASLGLSHPARTPMPEMRRPRALALPPASTRPLELLSAIRPPTTGARRVAVERSAYAARAERRGDLAEVVEYLHQVRREVRAGGTLIDAVADATLLGWRAREALNSVLDEPVANWDRRKGRTQLERRAVVERALAELGDTPHRGGWSVAGGGR